MINKTRRIFSSLLISFAALGGLGATQKDANASLIHDYELNGSLADSLGGPSLIADGGTIGATTYSFGADQGLSLAYSALGSTGLYSIETVFEFDQFGIWRKIIDFNNRTTDDGFYFSPSNVLDFFPIAAGSSVVNTPIFVDVVLTRDAATGLVSAYLNGVPQFSFIDSSGLATFRGADNLVHFFEDDAATGFNEASRGSADCIRIYNNALSASAVANLTSCSGGSTSVPEPGTLLLAALGLFALTVARRSSR
jgi:PEP-CTERM motif-containing protein